MLEKIKEIIINSQIHYLNEVLSKNVPEKHEQIKSMFDSHMSIIAQYCMDNYINQELLTEDFIKGLHKILYPAGYKLDTIIAGKRVHMIPGEYKIYDNGIESKLDVGVINKFVSSKDTQKEMQKLINNFNSQIGLIKDRQSRKDLFFWFALDLSNIHPFGDGNGRVATILFDLFLVKDNQEPVNFHYYKELDYKGARIAGELTIKHRDLKYLYDFIDKYSE